MPQPFLPFPSDFQNNFRKHTSAQGSKLLAVQTVLSDLAGPQKLDLKVFALTYHDINTLEFTPDV